MSGCSPASLFCSIIWLNQKNNHIVLLNLLIKTTKKQYKNKKIIENCIKSIGHSRMRDIQI